MNAMFDNDKLITVVQLQPAIWDKSNPDYPDKTKRHSSWTAVINFVWGEDEVSTWDEKKKQNEKGKELQNRWKYLRNSFSREVAKRKKIKSGPGRIWKTYVYFEQMSFLLPSMDHAPTESSFADDDGEVSEIASYSLSPPQLTEPSTSRISSKKRNCDDNLAEILAESLKRRQEKENREDNDADRLFLWSLLEDFKKIPVENKAGVKISLISAINNRIYSQPMQYSHPNMYTQQNLPHQFVIPSSSSSSSSSSFSIRQKFPSPSSPLTTHLFSASQHPLQSEFPSESNFNSH